MSEPRATCPRCLRPVSVCYCAHLPTLETSTRVVFLQHPRERDVAIGTARMASLCLPRSELHVGLHWRGTRALASIHADPSRPPALLYPGEGAIDVTRSPPTGPITLVVVDGTWAQAKKLVKQNPELAALPRYAFEPETPSAYRIRREPDERFVSTIEALAHVLGALERDPERFRALLEPFHAMVETQVDFVERVHANRHRRPRLRQRRGAEVPSILRARAADLVCLVAEANAWPYGHPMRGPGELGELVHLEALRLATGERLGAVVAPRTELAPSTSHHLELDERALREGVTLHAFREAWAAFARETDVLCTWGSFTPRLLREAGATLPGPCLDLRLVSRVLASRSVGALEDFVASSAMAGPTAQGPTPSTDVARGRAGRRLAMLAEVARSLADPPSR